MNTNARSLSPKIHSLIDCVDELEGALGVITETWLADGEEFETDVCDLACGAGLGLDSFIRTESQISMGLPMRGWTWCFNKSLSEAK